MAIYIKCYKCGDDLDEPGGILLGPPEPAFIVKKYHLCGDCYDSVLEWILFDEEK